jgi:hypothetical protein
MITIRVYNLRTEKQVEEFSDLYDDLYKDEHQELAIKNDLIEFQNSVNTQQELEMQINYLEHLYEGMTIRVESEGNLIYGGVLDDNTIDYILDELNLKKINDENKLDKDFDELVSTLFGGRRIV